MADELDDIVDREAPRYRCAFELSRTIQVGGSSSSTWPRPWLSASGDPPLVMVSRRPGWAGTATTSNRLISRAREENRTPDLLITRYAALSAVRSRRHSRLKRLINERCAPNYLLSSGPAIAASGNGESANGHLSRRRFTWMGADQRVCRKRRPRSSELCASDCRAQNRRDPRTR